MDGYFADGGPEKVDSRNHLPKGGERGRGRFEGGCSEGGCFGQPDRR